MNNDNFPFKEGDWIAPNHEEYRHVGLIKSLKNGMCLFADGNSMSQLAVEEDYHLWTIKDAKPGDIIISKCKYNKDVWVSIFSYLDTEQKVVWSYCGGCLNDDYFDKGSAYLKVVRFDFYPATSEECNILWQKMREKGYKWNSRTKEVVKAPFKLEGTLFSARDRGTIDEIIFALRTLGEEKMICYTEEINFLKRIRKL